MDLTNEIPLGTTLAAGFLLALLVTFLVAMAYDRGTERDLALPPDLYLLFLMSGFRGTTGP